jgi:hypothetical protein
MAVAETRPVVAADALALADEQSQAPLRRAIDCGEILRRAKYIDHCHRCRQAHLKAQTVGQRAADRPRRLRELERLEHLLGEGVLDLFAGDLLEDAPETIEGVAKSVGLLTDSMAALYNVGKTVRGWISGNTNQNPWVASMSDPGSMFQSQVDAAVLAEGDESTPEARGRLTAARLRKANREAYDQTVDDIQGAAKADQTERAVLAKYAPSTLPGGIGRNVAGEKYLENAGVTEAQTREVLAKAIRDAIGPVAAKVIEALAKPPPVQIDGQAASKHLANSRHHTTRTGG